MLFDETISNRDDKKTDGCGLRLCVARGGVEVQRPLAAVV
jgi:hypothetical protein